MKIARGDETNRLEIEKKQAEVDLLNSVLATSRELLEEYAAKGANVEECPECGAMLETMGFEDDFEHHAILTHKRYDCGYSEVDGFMQTPCGRRRLVDKPVVDNS